VISVESSETPSPNRNGLQINTSPMKQGRIVSVAGERTIELAGLFVGFAFALQ
jgi:hypothetical protein